MSHTSGNWYKTSQGGQVTEVCRLKGGIDPAHGRFRKTHSGFQAAHPHFRKLCNWQAGICHKVSGNGRLSRNLEISEPLAKRSADVGSEMFSISYLRHRFTSSHSAQSCRSHLVYTVQ